MTKQEDIWNSKFGKEYTKRNTWDVEYLEKWYVDRFGITCSDMNMPIINYIDKGSKILEVGCGSGNQIMLLESLGYTNLYGIEIQKEAKEVAEVRTKANIQLGSAQSLPYNDREFDVVRTSGLLIHISPKNIKPILDEIYRCCDKYIWGFEYFSDEHVPIEYRNKRDILWGGNFPKMFLDRFSDIDVVYNEKIPFLNDKNFNTLYLLKRGEKK